MTTFLNNLTPIVQAVLNARNATNTIDAQTQALQQQTAAAQASAAAALKAQTDANLLAESKSVPLNDSASALAAEDDQRQKLIAGSSFGIGLPDKLGAPPVGYRVLSGQ